MTGLDEAQAAPGTFEQGSRVRHDTHGTGIVEVQRGDLVTVDFGGDLHRVEARTLRPVDDLMSGLASGDLADPEEALLKAQALAINSVNGQWGVFSRSRVQLLPHQLWVCRQVTASWPFRWLVADDVGLGKTIEAGLILMPLIASGKVSRLLVLAPAKLVPQWQSRLKAMFDIRLSRYSAQLDDKRNNFWDTHPRVVASIQTLREARGGKRDRLLAADRWDLVIVDEAHHLNCDERMGDTLAYGLLQELQDRDKILSLLFFTGTPHRGKDYGFFGLMQLLRPDLFDRDKDRMAQLPLLRQAMIRNNKATVTDLRGERLFEPVTVEDRDYRYSAAEEEFYRTLSAFILDGRAYASNLSGRDQTVRMLVLITLQKLAASSIAAIRSALEKRRAKLARLVEEHGRARPGGEGLPNADDPDGEAAEIAVELVSGEIERLDELIALSRRIGEETKITRLLDMIGSELPEGENVLLFTEYKATQALVVNALQDRFGHGTCVFINGEDRLDGVQDASGRPGTLTLSREAAADAFNAGEVRFMISTEAGGEGIDLQENCSTLVHVDLPWNPMRMHQRVGRLSRFGQRNAVTAYLLRNPDTVESRVWSLLSEKLRRIQDALTGAMEEREDITQLVIGIAGESVFNELFAGASGRSGDGLRQWFDQKSATLDGRDIIDTARDLFGNVSRFDFQGVGRDVPKIDLDALEPFFMRSMRSHRRRVQRHEDGLRLKTPDGWRKTWGIREEYDDLVFDRNLKGENVAGRVLGVGHPLIDRALADALDVEVSLAAARGLEAPLLLLLVCDAITGSGSSVRTLVFGVTLSSEDDAVILPDWQLLERLNSLTAARGEDRPERVGGLQELVDGLTRHLEACLPESARIFARPTVRPEMLLLPASGGSPRPSQGRL